jgi:glycosyltransferase involved in cell wall biosynthesis
MRILVLTRYSRNGASSRLRMLQYIPYLEQQGHQFTVRPLFDEAYLTNLYATGKRSPGSVLSSYFKRLVALLTAPGYDLVWLQYELFPFFPAAFERILGFLGIKFVVDIDDAVQLNYLQSERLLVRKALGQKIPSVLRRASCVVAGCPNLAEFAKISGAARVEYIPTVVALSRYQRPAAHGPEGVVIGWVGSPSTQRYLLEIKDALARVNRVRDVRLVLVGADSGIRNQLEGIDADFEHWSEDREVGILAKMDIGIMPLSDGDWERGKCGYKLIQYMASGIPVIASPVGVNVDIVSNGRCGILASTTEEWELALLKLIDASELRQSMGLAGRAAVETDFSLELQAPRLARLLDEIA